MKKINKNKVLALFAVLFISILPAFIDTLINNVTGPGDLTWWGSISYYSFLVLFVICFLLLYLNPITIKREN